MKNKLLKNSLIIVLLLFANLFYAQTKFQKDNLLKVIPTLKDTTKSDPAPLMVQNNLTTPPDTISHIVAALSSDTARVNYYHKYISNSIDANRAGRKVNLDQLEEYAKTALELAQQEDYLPGIANISYIFGSIYWDRQNYQRAGEYYRKSLKLYETIGDINEISQLTFHIGICEYRSGRYSEALEYYLIALSLLKELNNNDGMFKCYNAISNAFSSVGDYSSELQSSIEALELAQVKRDTLRAALFTSIVATASKNLKDSVQAIVYYDKAFDLYKQLGNKLETAKTLNNKATLYAPTSTEKLTSFLESVKILEGITPPTSVSQIYLSHTYVNIGIWYDRINNQEMARTYFDKALATVKKTDNKFEMIFQYSRIAQYYFEQGNYPKSKQLAEQTIALINSHIGTNNNFDVALKIASKIYAKEGNYRKAYEMLETWSTVNDSIKAKDLRGQLTKIKRQYEFERSRQNKLNAQKLDIEQQKLSILAQRNMIAGLIASCLLLLIIGTLIYIYSRQLQAKNRILYKQIQEQDKLEDEIEERNTFIFQNSTNSELIRNGKLFAALKELMKDETIYTQLDIDRKAIADMLNTNEKYLFDSIKENTGLAFSEYINALRLNLAKKLLLDDNNFTIEDIAIRSGFGSRTTFHRQFRGKYQLSPAEFRKAALVEKRKS